MLFLPGCDECRESCRVYLEKLAHKYLSIEEITLSSESFSKMAEELQGLMSQFNVDASVRVVINSRASVAVMMMD